MTQTAIATITATASAAERAVLDAADAMFYHRGIVGVTMSEIRDTSGVSMRRLYSMYPSKRHLVTGWLQDRHVRWMAWFTDVVDQHVLQGTDAVLATFDALAEWVSSPSFRGCAFLNSIAETHEIDDVHRARLDRVDPGAVDVELECVGGDHGRLRECSAVGIR